MFERGSHSDYHAFTSTTGDSGGNSGGSGCGTGFWILVGLWLLAEICKAFA